MENDANGDAATAIEDTVRTADGRFTFSEIHRYLQDKSYPDGYTKADKTALRKMNFFSFKGSDLFYTLAVHHARRTRSSQGWLLKIQHNEGVLSYQLCMSIIIISSSIRPFIIFPRQVTLYSPNINFTLRPCFQQNRDTIPIFPVKYIGIPIFMEASP